MNPQAAQSYLRTKVLTATPEQLQLMLFDGAIRFGEQARVAIQESNFEQIHLKITQTQKIINELRSSLKRDVAPEMCDKLSALYAYAYRKLITANIERDVDALDEALNVLKYQRETWALLMQKLSKEKAGVAALSINMPSPDPRMEASISMRG